MADSIFMHDAVPTWSGFLYQGQIAAYLAVKWIYKLVDSDKKDDVDYYAIEMENCEDIAVVYENGDSKQYRSIHQVKNEASQRINEYKSPLTQLMMEKGFCQENGYGMPDAYLHVSSQISIKAGQTFEEIMEEWQLKITGFYENLCDLYNELIQGADLNETLKKIKNCVKKQPITLNRAKYENLLKNVIKLCDGDGCKPDLCKREISKLIFFLEQELYVPNINKDVKIYRYDDGLDYCAGPKVFGHIVRYVEKYKSKTTQLNKNAYEYIAGEILYFVQKSILERHNKMQRKENASCSIPLCDFMHILDEKVEKYEKEGNVLSLIRRYDELMEEYCDICKNEAKCLENKCRLLQPDSRRNILDREVFIKLCYNLNPECEESITDRKCLMGLLNRDGLLESVFPVIKKIPDSCYVKSEDKSRFKIRNQDKVAFLTAISNKYGSRTVHNIERALSKNQDLIESIFEADQLVTTRLEEPSSIWDSSCIRIKESDLLVDENEKVSEEHSIYVAKKPEFIKAEDLLERIGES